MTKDISATVLIEGIHFKTGKPISIRIVDGHIDISEEEKIHNERNNKRFIAPGLIDNQINGYANVDFSGKNLSVEGIVKATKAIWKEGVTSFLPTLISGSHENLLYDFRILSKAIETNKELEESIPGFHLEGPYISPVDGFRGCHPIDCIRKPTWNEFLEYQHAAGGRIIQVTVAPELEGAMDFIRLLVREGIVVSIGHTNASADQINQAVKEGAKLSTHLGNGCANLIHRHNNPIWPQLANDHLTPSIIADGHHLPPEEIQVFYKVKGPENIILTSDIVYLAGLTAGKYSFLGAEVVLTEEGMLLNTGMNCLAGASFPLKKGVENIMKFTGCSLAEAISMASTNVARIYKLNDRGVLAQGYRADLILFEKDGDQIRIIQTWLNGKLVYNESF